MADELTAKKFIVSIRLSTPLQDVISKAIDAPGSPGDQSRLIRYALRFCYPDVRDTFVSRKIDLPRNPTTCLLYQADRRAIERLAKARQKLSKADVPHLEENTGSDVIAESVRRYLVQNIEPWGLTSDEHRKAISLSNPVWPTLRYIAEFDEHTIPTPAFEMLKKFYQREQGPSTLPELLRLTRQRIGAATSFNVEDLTHADWAAEACKLLTERADEWGLHELS